MTHINAFEADVEAAKQEVAVAESKLAAAELALHSHPDFQDGSEEPKSEELVELGDHAEDVKEAKAVAHNTKAKKR